VEWFREARFGMFIHWGLYSVLGRHEWAMTYEAYRWTSTRSWRGGSTPAGAPREWVALAKRAGMRYCA